MSTIPGTKGCTALTSDAGKGPCDAQAVLHLSPTLLKRSGTGLICRSGQPRQKYSLWVGGPQGDLEKNLKWAYKKRIELDRGYGLAEALGGRPRLSDLQVGITCRICRNDRGQIKGTNKGQMVDGGISYGVCRNCGQIKQTEARRV